MGKFDIQKIKDDNALPDVAAKYMDLQSDGKEFKGLCIFHDDKDASLTFFQKSGGDWRYECFGCAEYNGRGRGDVIDFVMEANSCDWKTACEILGGERQPYAKSTRKKRAAKSPDTSIYDPYEPLPITEDNHLRAGMVVKAFNPKRAEDPQKRIATYKPKMVFPYYSLDGTLVAYVIRIDTVGGGKITPLLRWVKMPDGTEGWCHHHLKAPRPLYGLDRLRKPGQVFICEGEKAADAAFRILGTPALCWQGGSKAVKHADWSPLKGRNVVLFSDADEAGEKAMLEVAALVAPIADTVKVIGWDKEQVKGWDAADAEAEGFDKAMLIEWLRKHSSVYEPHEDEGVALTEAQPAPPVEAYEGASDEAEPQEPPPVVTSMNGDTPFRFLGYNAGQYYYLPDATQQVTRLAAAAHNKLHMLSLAPLEWWEEKFPHKQGFDADTAANTLMQRSAKVGVFTGQNVIRGRGAWLDGDDVVIHAGPHLMINGCMKSLREFSSPHVYEAAPQISIPNAKPATSKEAVKLTEICEAFTWEQPLSAALIAGWCIIAPVCGILPWRPHIWITGQSSSGKTTAIEDIVVNLIGAIGLRVDGKTSEAGIRQTIRRDARPVIIDEAESEDAAAAKRMQAIIDLARIASSGGTVVKGTTHGDPLTYEVRSAFCFSSINASVQHIADESRITKLVLMRNDAADREEHFQSLKAEIRTTLTPDYAARMFSRTLAHLPSLLANIKTFTDAAAIVLKSRRAADQIGVMLAGYYLCKRTDCISLEDAQDFIRKNEWDDYTAISAVSESSRCLERLTSHKLRVYSDSLQKDVSVVAGDLILIAANEKIDGAIYSEGAAKALRDIGISIKLSQSTGEEGFVIANHSTPLDAIFQGTPWASAGARGRQLRTITRSEKMNSMRFGAAVGQQRGTWVPLSVLKEDG